MTVTLAFQFPWGRYHATPWGRHVNEGAVELPPSPWRLLRMLYAVWRTRVPDLDEATVHALLDNLATPPVMFVPRHGISHTRHYYPDTKHTRATYSVDRTLDAFAVFDHGAELAVQWRDVDLPAEQQTALAKLAVSVPYLGRADSVCEARVEKQWQPSAHDVWLPVDVAEYIPENAHVTTVLAPERPLNLDSLIARPVDVRKQKLLFPACTRLLGYQRTETSSAPRRRRRPPLKPVHAVRFDIAQRVLPFGIDALLYTDLLRSAALARLGKRRTHPQNTVLGGKTAGATKASDDHAHAHYLPLLDAGNNLSGFVVWALDGLPDDELGPLLEVRSLWSPINDKWRATVRVAGTGDIDDVAPELSGTSRTWTSVTPFAPSLRYQKRSWTRERFLRAGIEQELRYRGHDEVSAEIELQPNWRGFRQARLSKPRSPQPAAMLRLHVDRPLRGPLALGALSHFGLGLFAPHQD